MKKKRGDKMFEKSKFFNKKANVEEAMPEVQIPSNEENLDDELYRLHLEKMQQESVKEDKRLQILVKEQMEKDINCQEMFDLVSKIRINQLKMKK